MVIATRRERNPARRSLAFALVAAVLAAHPTPAAERELDEDTPASSAGEVETPIDRVAREEEERTPFFPGLRQRLQHLPAFFADTQLGANFRTYYLQQDRADERISEAWALGGSLSYRSGWLEDLFSVEVEGFTSQRLFGPFRRDGTLLLDDDQDGYTVLGIANAKLRHRDVVLTGFRQYLDLPYVNRQDNRMTPNTFEAVTLQKTEGELRFSTGYTWKIKRRNSDEFVTMSEAVGVSRDRGLVHGGALWTPNEAFRIGAIAGLVPDLGGTVYGEMGIEGGERNGVEVRGDAQFTFQFDAGDDLLERSLDDNWSLGVRGTASYARIVGRLGFSTTGPNNTVSSRYGTNPSYVDLMQRTFTRADEKALLASLSYDFAGLSLGGLKAIVNFVVAFDGRVEGERRDAQEVDLTIDYRLKRGLMRGLWLRVRGSWLNEDTQPQNGTDVRLILRYDIPVI